MADILTYDVWLAAADKYAREHPQQRYGQALFNHLQAHKPDLANDVRGREMDPFYNTALVAVFLKYVGEHW